MSDRQNQYPDSPLNTVLSKLHICLFSTQLQFTESVEKILNSDRYQLKCFTLTDKLIESVAQNKEQIDCIVLVNEPLIHLILEQLWQSEILLPTVIVEPQPVNIVVNGDENSCQESAEASVIKTIYHQAEIRLYPTQLQEITTYINLAITKFLSLTPDSEINCHQPKNESNLEKIAQESLIIQQRRLTNKIKERLGYLGIYHKRNINDFYHNLSAKNQKELAHELSISYRQILLEYFEANSQINRLIDEFVDRAFFANISTSQILEIHMDLIDKFSYQLQLEGRNDDILLDYRLPLIDVISHLCEIYRRSIPGQDIALDLLFGVK
jgi:circadian clock protein KaiA